MTKIKICGLTNMEDALECQKLGVDYLGFIFAQTPRRADPVAVSKIVEALNGEVKTVGVFVDETSEALDIANYCSLDYVQLHGNQSNEFADKIGRERVIRVLKISNRTITVSFSELGDAAFYLYDTYSKTAHGGTGTTWDWNILKNAKELSSKIIVAGGINAENIVDIVSRLHPYAVDVSSGVEERPGKKDLVKLERLVQNVKKFSILAR